MRRTRVVKDLARVLKVQVVVREKNRAPSSTSHICGSLCFGLLRLCRFLFIQYGYFLGS